MSIDKLMIAVTVDKRNGNRFVVEETDSEDYSDTVDNNKNCRAHTANVFVVSRNEVENALEIAQKFESIIHQLDGKNQRERQTIYTSVKI